VTDPEEVKVHQEILKRHPNSQQISQNVLQTTSNDDILTKQTHERDVYTHKYLHKFVTHTYVCQLAELTEDRFKLLVLY